MPGLYIIRRVENLLLAAAAGTLAGLLTGILLMSAMRNLSARPLLAEARRTEADAKARLTRFFGDQALLGALSPAQQPASRVREIAVLSASVDGFTAFCETAPPEEIRARIDALLPPMIAAVIASHGVVDKFHGAGLTAFFGAPFDLPNPAKSAIEAARAMAEALAKIPGAKPAIGVDFGPAFTGSIGTTLRMEYTALGDVPHVAAGLEQRNQALGTAILVSSRAMSASGIGTGATPKGPQPIPGRTAAIDAFEC